MRTKEKQTGFTLVEAAIILVIIGILGAIAVPNFLSWLPNMRLRAEARDLYSSMQKARMEAIKRNQNWAIVFDTANNGYSIYSSPGADNDWTESDDNVAVQTHTLNFAGGIGYGKGNIIGNNSVTGEAFPADNVSYSSPDNVLVLNPRGTGSSGYVYLQNQSDSVYAVGTQSSGHIVLRRWLGGSWQ